MKLLVTGGCGFIGANFIRYWLEKHPEDRITNLDKLNYAANPQNLDGLPEKNYRFVKGDISDRELVDKLVSQNDAVINFAAETHVDSSIASSHDFVQSNIIGVHSILEAVKKHNKRFHHVSTDEVYGALSLESEERFSEKTPYDPRNPYSATKAAADHLIVSYFHTYGIPVTISNCTNNYGRYQDKSKLIPKVILHALHNKPIDFIYGKGANVRDWIYVEDHCDALARILEKGKAGENYMIGGNCEKSNLEVVKEILKLMGKPDLPIVFIKDRLGHDMRYAADSSKIEKELGWKPKHGLEQGLKETIGWYTEKKQMLFEKTLAWENVGASAAKS